MRTFFKNPNEMKNFPINEGVGVAMKYGGSVTKETTVNHVP